MRKSQGYLATAFALVLAAAAQAEMITFAFSGTITSVSQSSAKPIGDAVKVNDLFYGTYTFNSLTPDSNPESGYGEYYFDDGGLSITLGSLQLAIPGANFFIWGFDRPTYDRYTVGGFNVSSAGLWIPEFPVVMSSLDTAAFNSEALPLIPPSLDRFVSPQLSFNGSKPDVGTFSIQGTFESLILIPEPSGLLLLALGLALAARRYSIR